MRWLSYSNQMTGSYGTSFIFYAYACGPVIFCNKYLIFLYIVNFVYLTRAVESLGRTKIWSSPLVVSGTQSPASNSISHGHYGRITNIIQSPVVLLEFQKKISFWQEMITFRNTEMFWKVLYCVKDIYLISGSLFFDHFFLIWKWILCFNTLQEDDFFFLSHFLFWLK